MRLILAVLSLSAATLLAQNPPAAFEVATVKPSGPSGNGVSGGCHGVDSVYTPNQMSSAPPLGRCVIHDARLAHMIYTAFRIPAMNMIRSGPDWIQRGDERYDVMAKADNPSKTTEEELLKMLQALLVERFQLKYHLEPIEVQGFGLVVAKGGPKLTPSKSDDVETRFGGASKGKPAPGQPTTLAARKYSIARLATLLSAFGGNGPIVDKTELPGEYDFTLSWDDNAGPTLSTALREQLGLRLEAQKVKQSTFVVDSAKKPGDN
jgi:uncharacterized protein (TIGR03435 family)